MVTTITLFNSFIVFLSTEYDLIFYIALSRYNFEKFMIKVAKKNYFNVFWHVITI